MGVHVTILIANHSELVPFLEMWVHDPFYTAAIICSSYNKICHVMSCGSIQQVSCRHIPGSATPIYVVLKSLEKPALADPFKRVFGGSANKA